MFATVWVDIGDMTQAQTHNREDVTDPLRSMARRNAAKAEQQGASFQAALSQAFARMCADYPGLKGAVTKVALRRVSLAELVDLTEPGMFLALLEGPGDAMGMIWICRTTLAAMVEAQTTGAVMPVADTAGTPRLPTRTDAALMAPMIDSFLHKLSVRCAELPESASVSGYLYGSFLDDRRPIGVVLDDIDYDMLTIRVALSDGAVSGTWTLVVPRPAPAPADKKADGDSWESCMAEAVENSAVSLNAVLCRVKLTLEEALALTKGDVLRVPDAALETLGLTATGGAQVASGRLGQAHGFRAVRLVSDPGGSSRNSAYSVPTLRLSKAAGHGASHTRTETEPDQS